MGMEKNLINLVKEHEFLYNRRATYYKDLARKEEKWTEIAAELNIEVKKAKQRWKSLRDRFAREYSKMKISGLDVGDVSWRFFDALIFLKDCTEPREKSLRQIKSEVIKSEVNAKNINELFSTFLSENEESGQGPSGNRAQDSNNFQKNVPVVYKIERSGLECTNNQDNDFNKQGKFLTNSNTEGTEDEHDDLGNGSVDSRSHNTNFQKEPPILISFDNSAITAKTDPLATKTVSETNRFIQTAATISTVHTPQIETFVRSFFNAMAIQVEQANLNFQTWATIQQEVLDCVNRNIIQSAQQQSNRISTNCTQNQTVNGIS